MFEQANVVYPFGDTVLQAALNELTDRWRAEARAEEQSRFEAKAAALAASFEAGATHLAEVRATQAAIGAQEARRARAVAAFCRSRPSSLDRPEFEIGAAAAATRAARPTALLPVSEWAIDEIAVGLSLTESGATRMVVQSLQLVDRLPGTLDALERGQLTWDHARVMAELVAPLGDALRAEAEVRLLGRLGSKTPTQLRAAAHRWVARCDAEAISRRVREAIRDRRISVYPGPNGMATLSATLPIPVARAIEDALGQYADAAATPGDERTRVQRMVDCLVDLIVRPGEHGLAPVQAQLTVVATVQTMLGTDDEPGEVNGNLVPAETVRRLAESLGLLPADSPATRSTTGRTQHPETQHPETQHPETQHPETQHPETQHPETQHPETQHPETQHPETQHPETQHPETQHPETQHPETQHPETQHPETQHPETQHPETQHPETQHPETQHPETQHPETQHPETQHPETQHPETQHPETQHPETQHPETQHPETQHPEPATALPDGLAALLAMRSLAETALGQRPHIAVVDELTGQLLALTDAAGLRSGRALGPPPAADAYSPTVGLERFVRLRDRRCRFPGCRKRPIRCDLDHTIPWPWGPTAHDNLYYLCRHHHRLSHQAPGWRLRGLANGGLEWRTPTGQVLVTHAPRYGADDDLPMPGLPATAAAGRPAETTDARDGDPPPF